MHPGRGPGLTPRNLGQTGGVETVTLTENQMPSHDHAVAASASPSTTFTPAANTTLARSVGGAAYRQNTAPNTPINAGTLAPTGGSQAHDNRQPYLALNFIIALTGLFPSRS